MILFLMCNSAKRFVPLLLLLGIVPLAVSAQGKAPGYAIRSSIYYRERGVANAHGRFGPANVTARALLGKDNNTTVELTTGALDSNATPPGTFVKVRFRPLDPDGDPFLLRISITSGPIQAITASSGRHCIGVNRFNCKAESRGSTAIAWTR